MHQPFYKDLWTGQYKLPWTRLHALKDYAGMVRVLDEFPRVRQTFNLVPSMVVQIAEYAAGTASDPFFDCAAMPAEALTEAQRTFVLRYFFQANVERIIGRYPRYLELYYRRNDPMSIQDLRDLQVLSQLAWFDEDVLAQDKEIQELIRKGRDYTLADQERMVRKQREALAAVLPVYRDFAARGQIEISTTPFYHPILPLLCDSDIAAVSHPGVNLPQRFQYPQDALTQLERARSYMRDTLGVTPAGLWPSEGSVSDEALAMAAGCGFTWAASDNGVLSRTLNKPAGCEETYQPYLWKQDGRDISLLFRDHYLSDLIGFEYSRMGAEEAAKHFLSRIRENTGGKDVMVPIILDGENAWEWYEANGRPFLRALYRHISEDPHLEATTVSKALARYDTKPLHHVAPGSWINANFDIWIGADEDNRAWNLLLDARRVYDEHAEQTMATPRLLAYEELLIAEGSDWCWWYGPEHGSENRPEFDQLYRDHLSNVYRALGLDPPGVLSSPILQTQEGEVHEPPSNSIDVTLDGEVTSAFEWMGAGHYRPDSRSGAMHGGQAVAREMFYGSNGTELFVRLDTVGTGKLGIEFETGPAKARVVAGRIVEMEAPRKGDRFRVTVKRDGLPTMTLPAEGWIEFKQTGGF
ncbi:MAG: glycoside hydrolase, family 57 [Bryobacterales bacterium]|nr:glycoside hydrolase, family 57 [Bryobacterales bacterium]